MSCDKHNIQSYSFPVKDGAP